MDAVLFIHLLVLLFFPPLLLGIIHRVKAIFAGRQGPPLLQPYYDLVKLLGKGAVYSSTTSWVFRAGPMIGLASTLCAGLIIPLACAKAPLGFMGDVILFAGLLGMGRFATMAAALDTGSAFEGMGASREGAYGAFAEPALFLSLAILCVNAHAPSFQSAFEAVPPIRQFLTHPAFLAALGALFVVLLTENCRIPVDDPNTHLELTMIHEVMVLDHSGPDFAYILYGSALKLFVLGAVMVHVFFPFASCACLLQGTLVLLGGQILLAILIGVVESVMARVRLVRVPHFLIGASVLACIGLASIFFRGTP